MNPGDWVDIAHSIVNELRLGVSGLVVTHGTDTMVYTATAVSYLVRTAVPIVFTGANAPWWVPHSAGLTNIRASFLAAGSDLPPGIYTAFPDHSGEVVILQSNRTKEIQPYELVFGAAKGAHAGAVSGRQVRVDSSYVERANQRQRVEGDQWGNTVESFDPRVARLKVYPGFDPELFEAAAYTGARAILLELYHSGTANTTLHFSLLGKIKEVSAQRPIFGVPGPVILSSEGHRQRTAIPVFDELSIDVEAPYQSSASLEEAGLIALPPMTSEAALVKLMWSLAQTEDVSELIQLMSKDIAGESLSD